MALVSRHKPLTIEGALAKLRDFSIIIDRRGGLRDNEHRRAAEAETLLRKGPPEPGSKGEKNRKRYFIFLRKVTDLSGPSMVVLSAAALGLSAISNIRDRVRLDLPYEINSIKNGLLNPTLRSLGAIYSGAPSRPNVSSHQQFGTSCQREKQKADEPDFAYLTAFQSSYQHVQTSKDLQSVSLGLRLNDLVDFLQQNHESNQQLQMECPFSGDPLPFIRFNFAEQAELHATLEFSQPLATLFIQYVMNRGVEQLPAHASLHRKNRTTGLPKNMQV